MFYTNLRSIGVERFTTMFLKKCAIISVPSYELQDENCCCTRLCAQQPSCQYSNLRFYCPLNCGFGTLAMPYPLQSPPTDNKRP